MFMCYELQDYVRNDHNFLPSVLTGGNSWVFYYDPESMAREVERQRHVGVLFGCRGIAHEEFLT